MTLQEQYNLAVREVEWEVLPAAVHNGLGVLPWSPLASGFLTGKYARGVQPGPDTRAGGGNPLYQYTSANYANADRTWDAVDAVVQVAEETGASPAQVALSWVADRTGVTTVIIGARDMRQLTDNLGAADLHLDADAAALLDKASDPSPTPYPYGPFGLAQSHRTVNGGAQLD
ncbi:aldo/keto reductase [Streptomyces sp. DSM 40750]|uniref:aldo/keto reductase n=1 Tax=Streptomyces sp. DSM 40750 TaxID=2801030 RepID=UPI00214BB91F|nr:aldo/keto reductase [Streptomyces sp. DSM 40750]UUU19242.1 aldo/keto reductase [Streptomyces sp. DSM 40750]UUU27414.1 aldo/keto reductase [Streptomyces sp. DSM 40750]